MRNPSVIACGDASPLSQGGLLVQHISPPCQRGDTAEGGGGIPSHCPPCLPPWGRCPRRGRRGPASPVLSLRGGAKPRRGNPYPALSVSSAASSPTGGAKTRPRTPTTLASPLGGGAPAGGGEGPHPPSCHCEERSDAAIRTPYLSKFYIICYDLSKRCQWR